MTPAQAPARVQRDLWRILIVDDEPAVIQVARRFLEDTRYEVSVAANAEEALQVTAERGPFDLYVLDVMMPGMKGTELAELLRERQPDAPVLFFTAFSNRLFQGRRVLGEREAFLQKPVSKREMLEAVSLLLFHDLKGPRKRAGSE